MIPINLPEENVCFNFPQSSEEISKESLIELTKHFTLGKSRVLLCLVGTYNLFAVRTAIRGSKEITASVNPIIAKISDDIKDTFGFNVGDVALVAPSDVERGIHANVSCGASYSNLQRIIKKYKSVTDKIIDNSIKDENGNDVTDICALSFKIVNAYDIAAAITKGEKSDAFVTTL
mgnify:FL=1